LGGGDTASGVQKLGVHAGGESAMGVSEWLEERSDLLGRERLQLCGRVFKALPKVRSPAGGAFAELAEGLPAGSKESDTPDLGEAGKIVPDAPRQAGAIQGLIHAVHNYEDPHVQALEMVEEAFDCRVRALLGGAEVVLCVVAEAGYLLGEYLGQPREEGGVVGGCKMAQIPEYNVVEALAGARGGGERGNEDGLPVMPWRDQADVLVEEVFQDLLDEGGASQFLGCGFRVQLVRVLTHTISSLAEARV